ncbi:alpha/beta fold hydrolase [Aliiroseovarius sp. PTFE2010]|uniref:alpha/beta fold hydrolase n=1 Tax=Aliiroseovarius sp. PTFE2010 TaxID=3417190 RepID=UPI003CF2A4A5
MKKLAVNALFLSTIAAVAIAATVGAATLRTRAVHSAYPPEGRLIDIDGRAMLGTVAGPQDAPHVVLIHGSSGSTRDMSFALAPALAQSFRVFSIDRPGLGWSQARPDGHLLSDQADAIRRTAGAMGARAPIVLGQSYGGAVSLAWALDAPGSLSALVQLSAPSHEWDGGLSTYYKALSHPLSGPVMAWLLNAWVPRAVVRREMASVFTPQTMPEGYPDHFGPRMTLRHRSLRANAVQRAALQSQIAGMDARYGSLTLPIEILHGTHDDTVPLAIHAEQLARDAPNAHLTRLDGIGHMPHHVAVADVVAAVDRAALRAGLYSGF